MMLNINNIAKIIANTITAGNESIIIILKIAPNINPITPDNNTESKAIIT